jgi:protein-tyrosine phosphatase
MLFGSDRSKVYKMPDILFVCDANRFRSVIAAESFRSLLQKNATEGKWVVTSAGTWAKIGLPPLAQAIIFAKSRGLNIEDHRSKEVSKPLLENADLIIVMTEGQKEALSFEFPQVKKRIVLLSEIGEGHFYDIPDPMGKLDETMEELGLEICNLVNKGFSNICKKVSSS